MRFRPSDTLEGLVAFYLVDFEDRLLGIPQGPGIVGNPAVLANVGSVSTEGVEMALNWRPMTNFTWFTSLAFNDSEYDDDYTTVSSTGVATVVPVAGKQVTDTPEVLFKTEVGYDNGSFFVRADVNHTDERFYTYLNDGGVDAYTLLNLGVGYRFTIGRAIEELATQVEATNVTDETYYSTIDSNGFVDVGSVGRRADPAARSAEPVFPVVESQLLRATGAASGRSARGALSTETRRRAV